MKILINVAAVVFLLFSLWKECHSVPLQDDASDLANLQEYKIDKKIEDKPNEVDRLVQLIE